MTINRLKYRYASLLLILLGLQTPNAYAKEFHALEDIAQTAHDYVLKKLQTDNDEIKITIGQLDPRLRLHKCSLPLEAQSPDYQSRQGIRTVGIRCNDIKPWSLFVPVSVMNLKKVALLKHAVIRNTLLTENDIVFEKMNINRLTSGYFESIEHLTGKVLTQNLTKGTVLTKHHIKSPVAINRGQMVTLIAKNSAVEVSTEGKAMSKGALGERIKVKNLKTERIVEGVIIDKHLINVNL